MENEKGLKISCFSDVSYEPPKWLCKPYFPIGKLTLVQGDPGCGKTAFLCKMAALTSIGGKFLNNYVAQGNVLILSVEDDESTLRGRIEASGGDLRKCFFVEEAYDVDFCHEGLQEAIHNTQAKLVVFDPIQSFFGADINTNLSNQTRPILAYLAQVAKEEECAIVLLAHMAKAKEGKSNVLRALGSVDIPGAARSVLQIGRNPSDNKQCVVAHVKSSNAAIGDSFTYTIGERGGVTIGEYTQLTAYDLDTASARANNGVRYEDEPVVRVVRKLMEENTAIECIGYSALTEISERLYGKAPYSNGKGWKAAIKRVQRELVARDKIIVKDAKTVESEYVIFGEHKEKGNTQIRGISLSKTLPIDLDALLGKDDEENE
ncbi:AAA family ATPase [Peptoniphilus mikwangii]|uniref:AAA family ATPase n=1 Tax=Peptoniphilus mikwangii TaxID=1354300 RepID=UPI00041522E6|nr:AAA family ATPase [Peptoniphilus mikwangii]